MLTQSIVVYNIFYINSLVFSVLSKNIVESACHPHGTFLIYLNILDTSVLTHTQSVVIRYVIVWP